MKALHSRHLYISNSSSLTQAHDTQTKSPNTSLEKKKSEQNLLMIRSEISTILVIFLPMNIELINAYRLEVRIADSVDENEHHDQLLRSHLCFFDYQLDEVLESHFRLTKGLKQITLVVILLNDALQNKDYSLESRVLRALEIMLLAVHLKQLLSIHLLTPLTTLCTIFSLLLLTHNSLYPLFYITDFLYSPFNLYILIDSSRMLPPSNQFSVAVQRLQWRSALRQINHQAIGNYQVTQTSLTKRNSKIDKIRKWINKAKIQSRSYQQLLQGTKSNNFSNYIQEVCEVLVKIQFSSEDLPKLVQLISNFHQEYQTFSSNITKTLSAYVLAKEFQDQQARADRQSNLLNLMSQIFICGIPISLEKILDPIRQIFSKSIQKALLNFKIVASFVQKFSCQLLGKDQYSILSQFPNLQNLIPPQKKMKLFNFFSNFVEWFESQFKQISMRQYKWDSRTLQERTQSLIEQLKKVHACLCTEMRQIQLPQLKPQQNHLPQQLLYRCESQMKFYTQFKPFEVVNAKRKQTQQQRNRFVQEFQTFLNRHGNLDSLQKTDFFTMSFLKTFNQAKNRRILQDYFMNHRKDYYQVQYWCRCLAQINQSQKHYYQLIYETFKQKYQKTKGSNNNDIQKRKRLIKIYSQLVKFRVFAPQKAIGLLRQLIDNITPGNTQVLTQMLDSCGRFLFVNKYSDTKMKETLEYLNNTLKTKCFSLHHETFIKNSMRSIIPGNQPSTRKLKKERSQLQNRIRQLILFELNSKSIEQVSSQLINLQKDALQQKIIYRIIKTAKIYPYDQISNLAVVIRLVSEKLYSIVPTLLMVIKEHYKCQFGISPQDDLALIKLFGELYSFQIIDKEMLIKQFKLILQGSTNRVLRIQMFCHLYQCVNQYFRGQRDSMLRFELFYRLLQYFHNTPGISPIRVNQVEDLVYKCMPLFSNLTNSHCFFLFQNKFKSYSGNPLQFIKYFNANFMQMLKQQQQTVPQEKQELPKQGEVNAAENVNLKQQSDLQQKLAFELQAQLSQLIKTELQKSQNRIIKPIKIQEKKGDKKKQFKGRTLLIRQGNQTVHRQMES